MRSVSKAEIAWRSRGAVVCGMEKLGAGSVYLRGRIWWVRYKVSGREIRHSAATADETEARAYLARCVERVKAGDLVGGIVSALDGAAISGKLLISLRQPIVYAWIRSGAVLYVGCGEQGFIRPLDPRHHRLRDVRAEDEIKIWPCASRDQAYALEAKLIEDLRPQLNCMRPVPRRTGRGTGLKSAAFIRMQVVLDQLNTDVKV
jgi:hypothetical protein